MSYASPANIIIGKVVVDYYAAPGQEVTGAMVNALTEYIEAEVLAAIEEYLSELDPIHEVITCEEVTIELSEQALEGWAQPVAERVKEFFQSGKLAVASSEAPFAEGVAWPETLPA
ncbi:MAG TPA: hypothetical protein DCE41_22195, partial [Cytophagales bacterium]|nr:hypothetical protein [Cytophagales bacterium]